VGVSLSDIDNILRDICLDNEYRILMTSDVQALALADGVELGTVMAAYDLSIWVILIAGLLYMLPTASICLCLEPDIICYRLRKTI
jgi:hypothetical protein